MIKKSTLHNGRNGFDWDVRYGVLHGEFLERCERDIRKYELKIGKRISVQQRPNIRHNPTS
jgi:hypothetical protein